jgi:hypothetical protein
MIASCTAVEATGMHATATETTTMEAAAAITEAATSTAASIGVIGDQGCRQQDNSWESNQDATEHGAFSPCKSLLARRLRAIGCDELT